MTEIELLNKLKSLLKEMKIYTKFLAAGAPGLTQDSLMVDIPGSDELRSRQMYISFFPNETEFEGSRLLQFYTQIPVKVTQESRQSLLWFLPLVNNRCAIGHFGLTNEMDVLQFRYVYTLQSGLTPKWGHMKDILDLMIYTPDLFHDLFLGIEAGKSFEELMPLLSGLDREG